MRIRTYNASRGIGKKCHWGRSIRLEWGTRGIALLVNPHPAIWRVMSWNINEPAIRSICCQVGPLGLLYANKPVVPA